MCRRASFKACLVAFQLGSTACKQTPHGELCNAISQGINSSCCVMPVSKVGCRQLASLVETPYTVIDHRYDAVVSLLWSACCDQPAVVSLL